jgi:hypothetical protein
MKFLRSLIFVLVLFTFVIAEDPCPILRNLMRKRGFLKQDERITYCNSNCDFLPELVCEGDVVERKLPAFITKAREYINKTRTVEYSRKGYGEVSFNFDDSWWELLEFCLPFLLAIIPVGISHTRLDYSVKMFFYVLWVIGTLLYDMDWMLSVYNITTVVFCFCIPERSQAAATVVVNMVIFFVAIIFALGYKDMWIQIGLGLFSMGYFLTILYRVIQKGNIVDYPAFFIVLIQFFGLGRIIYLLMAYKSLDSIQLRMIQFVTEAVLPLGPSTSLWSNAFLDTIWVVSDLRKIEGYHYWFIFFFTSFWFLFLGVRGLIGVILIKRLRVKVDLRSLGVGFYVYMADFFGGFHYIIRILLGVETPSHARTAYAIIHLTLFFREFMGAREFLVLRFLVSVIDYSVWDAGFSKVPKYANGNVDLGGIAFPKEGSFPWFSLDKLSEIASSVKRVLVSNGSSVKSGVGLIVKDERGMVGLYSVRHVLEDGDSITIDGEKSQLNAIEEMGKSIDPVVFTRVDNVSDGAEISVLVREEIPDVKFLFTVHFSGMVSMIKDFKFNNEGDVICAVNIKQGDSGSPVIGILGDGSPRFVGGISRGSFGEGQGNFVSCLTGTVNRGSPGFQTNYLDVVRREDEANQTALDLIADIFREMVEVRDTPDDTQQGKKQKKEKFRRFRNELNAYVKFLKDPALCTLVLSKFDNREVIDFNQYRARRFLRPGIGGFTSGGMLGS